jgi:hypothetical protein
MEAPTNRPTFGEMLGEVADLGAGLGIVLLPLFSIAIPGVLLMLVVPVVLLLAVAAIPVVVVGAIVTPPYLLCRAVRRFRARGLVPNVRPGRLSPG